MVGYHYHNGDPDSLMGGAYVRERLLRPLKGYGHEYGEVLEIEFPAGMRKRLRDPGATEKATMKELGIGYPTLVYAPRAEETIIMDPKEILKLHEKTELERLKRRGPGMSAGPSSSAGSSGPSGYSRSGGGGGAEIDPFRLDTNALLTSSGSGRGARGGSGFDLTQLPPEARISLRKFDFIIQFSWVETYPSTREKAREEAALKKAQEEGLAPAEGEEGEEAAVPSPTDTVSTPSTPVEPVAEENPEATTEDTEEMTEPETPDSSAETDESASTDSEDAP